MTIEKAVEIVGSKSSHISCGFTEAMNVLYELGKEYIGITGLPEERKVDLGCADSNEYKLAILNNGFNVALHLCKLSVIKGYVKKDKIKEIIDKEYPDIHEEVDDYEFRGDDGDYGPNGDERFLMEDFTIGLMEAFVEKITKAFLQADIIKVKEERKD